MPSHTTAANITIRETLNLLDGPFASIAKGIGQDQYAFWLGSGISLGRVEGLKKLIPRVLDHLQRHLDGSDPHCRFRATLNQIIELVTLNSAEKAAIDFEQPITAWPTLSTIVDRLITNYARFLDLAPHGEEADYLVWEGINVSATYADPTIEPDSEHLCLAVLILEGVVSQMPSANWDGLIERAIEMIAPGNAALMVCILPEDLRAAAQQTMLYKFHGCAVCARRDEAKYRSRLIARFSQINSWRDQADNRAIVNRLVDIAMTKRTLMLGLSVQDANIQSVFALAQATMPWEWPIDPPAYAFSEDELGFDQRSLLQNVYRSGYTAATRNDIFSKALVRAFAKPLLAALVLHVICSKLEQLLELAPSALSAAERTCLASGLKYLRNVIGDATPPTASAVQSAIGHFARLMMIFHEGDAAPANLRYQPITSRPTQYLETDASIATAGLRELAVASALLGMGTEQGQWSIQTVDPATPSAGVFQIMSGARASKVYIVANTTSATKLRLNGHLADGDDAILIYSLDIAATMPRSPRSRRTRTGVPGVREVSIADLLVEATTSDELMQRFREEISA